MRALGCSGRDTARRDATERHATRRWRAAWLAHLAILVLPGCEPPDRPPALGGNLPAAAIAYLEPDRISTFQLEDGVTYRAVRSASQPWSLHLLEVDLSRCEIGFQVVRAGEGEGRLSVSEMAGRSEPGVIAAVNGDFFTPEDLPLGVEVSDGKLRGRTSRPVFAWKPGGLPWVGPVSWEDEVLRLGDWTLTHSHADVHLQVVSGFPPLLEKGGVVGDLQQGDRPEFAAQRHPRTAVGFDPWRQRVWLVVVDGRREGSEGMTLPELTDLFRSLGAREAINLDGGGSSVMVIRRQAVNRPSDPAGQRPVVNALVVRQDPAYCAA